MDLPRTSGNWELAGVQKTKTFELSKPSKLRSKELFLHEFCVSTVREHWRRSLSS